MRPLQEREGRKSPCGVRRMANRDAVTGGTLLLVVFTFVTVGIPVGPVFSQMRTKHGRSDIWAVVIDWIQQSPFRRYGYSLPARLCPDVEFRQVAATEEP